MPLIVLDGPEKAGKSTIAKILETQYGARVRHWGKVPGHEVYLAPLIDDVADPGLVVWDRSWASEAVYGDLLGRDRELARDPWLGEWLYGRAIRSIGIRAMILGPSVASLRRNRDATDLPVDPAIERKAFSTYAKRFGWAEVVHRHVEGAAEHAAHTLVTRAYYRARGTPRPPIWSGPPDASVVIVGERRNEESSSHSWLPFTTRLTTELGRRLGDAAVTEFAWTNAHDCPPEALRDARTLVACGVVATKWAKYHVGHPNVLDIPHPAWLFRWGKAKGLVDPTIQRILGTLQGA